MTAENSKKTARRHGYSTAVAIYSRYQRSVYDMKSHGPYKRRASKCEKANEKLWSLFGIFMFTL